MDFSGQAALRTPIAQVEEIGEWQQLLWTWRICGVTPDCHVFAHLRNRLSRQNILSAYKAKQQDHGARVQVAGLNIRPHRPPPRSGKPVLFNSLEDETGILQTVSFGRTIEEYTATFLTAPALILKGLIERKGKGAGMRVLQAKSLHLDDFSEAEPSPTIPHQKLHRIHLSDRTVSALPTSSDRDTES